MAKLARDRSRGARPPTPDRSPGPLFSPEDIVDAADGHEYARAMGLLTWGTWDAEARPFEERLKDFLQAYPPEEAARFQGSMLEKTLEGEYGPAPQGARLLRFEMTDHSFGTLAEVLARYGLKRRSGPDYVRREIEVAPFREIAFVRNQRLRVLHGRVDIEADNMDVAKAAEVDRLEKKRAAEQIRDARRRMREDH